MSTKSRGTLCSILTVVAVGMHAFARTIVVPAQPVSPYADTEVSTNIQFSTSSEHAREVEMRFALDGCMSNCVQVAFDKDADGDGVLGAEEAETVYGWRNGRYFAESVTEGLRVEEADSVNVDSRVFAINFRLKKGEGLRYFTATNDMGVASSRISTPPSRIGCTNQTGT